MTTWKDNPDGTRTWHVDQDALYAASLLEGEDAPELTQGSSSNLPMKCERCGKKRKGGSATRDVILKEQR